jgi:hypothetical protein
MSLAAVRMVIFTGCIISDVSSTYVSGLSLEIYNTLETVSPSAFTKDGQSALAGLVFF